jgi:hypothetical protein
MHHAQLHMQQYRTQVVIVILEKITSVGRRPGQAIVYCYLDQRKVRKNRIDQSEMSMLDGIPSFHHTFVKPDHLMCLLAQLPVLSLRYHTRRKDALCLLALA